jgi:outer membrane protein W
MFLLAFASPAALSETPEGRRNWLIQSGAEESVVTPEESATSSSEDANNEMSNEELVDKINVLEIELIKLKKAAGMYGKGKKIALPKNGVYVQADIGIQDREWSGESGNTQTFFNEGIYGGLAIGYRYDRNFRFALEYSEMNNDANRMRAGNGGKLFRDPKVNDVILQDGSRKVDANGDVKLQSYTFNAYYDLNGFGHEKRFRPFIGAGVGLQTTTINGLTPSFFPLAGLGAEANGSSTDPVITVEAGLSYLATDNAEFFVGGEYSFVDGFLLENTDFGNLLPQGSRNWILKTGARYTF